MVGAFVVDGTIHGTVGAAIAVIMAASNIMITIATMPVWPMTDSATHQYRYGKSQHRNKNDWPYRRFQ
jgi:hypothetical protein